MLSAIHSSFCKVISLTSSSYIEDWKDEHRRYPDLGELKIKSEKHFLSSARAFFVRRWSKSIVFRESFEDYEMHKYLAQGSFGKVVLAQNLTKDILVAIKYISKEQIIKQCHIQHILNEKFVLQSLNCPLTIYLMNFFMDNSYIYFVMPFVSGGDLFDLFAKLKYNIVEEPEARFYMAQIILAIEYLHNLKLIYRDLKPENILVDCNGYLKLGDFGFCKLIKKGRTYTICGTPQYMAPEVILDKGYGFSVDWWAAGVLVYELTTNCTPFDARDPLKIHEKAASGLYKMHRKFSDDLKDLITNLLQTDLTKRYGNIKGGSETIKNHKWFKSIDWLSILNRKVPAPHFPHKTNKLTNKSFFRFKPPLVDPEDKYADQFSMFK